MIGAGEPTDCSGEIKTAGFTSREVEGVQYSDLLLCLRAFGGTGIFLGLLFFPLLDRGVVADFFEDFFLAVADLIFSCFFVKGRAIKSFESPFFNLEFSRRRVFTSL